jgi:CPSF A subunit region
MQLSRRPGYGWLVDWPGVLLPFTSREDVDFFSHLEMHLRQDHPPLCGRDHLSFRSAYFPVKDTVDGDLCEQFPQVSACSLAVPPARLAAREEAFGPKWQSFLWCIGVRLSCEAARSDRGR